MKRLSNKKSKTNLSPNQRKRLLVISVLLLIILALAFGISKVLDSWAPVENITSKTIDIQFSTKEVVCDDVKLTISTTTDYDIYYYIDLKNEETADEISFSEEDLEKNNTSNTTTKTVTKKISNSLYKKYGKEIIVKNNATIYLKYAKGNKFCASAYSFEVNNIDKQGPTIGEIKTSATNDSIKVTIEATDNKSSEFTYYFKLAEDKEFICTEDVNEYTFEDLEKNETYTIYVKVADGFGNESEAATDCTVSSTVVAIDKQKYHIKVNIGANTVTIYTKENEDDEEYTKPIKAMVCSTGSATPKSGTYSISYKYRWLALFGNVYGQYSTRIVGHILFHSVPYYESKPDTLEYEEYDKLGTKASAGCIRLTVADAKWIYDNVASGSTVEFYSDASNPGPLGKPSARKISNYEYRDWDPTDPNPDNPWHTGTGKLIGEDDEEDEDDNNTNEISNDIDNSINNEIYNSISNEVSNDVNNELFTNEIPWGTED